MANWSQFNKPADTAGADEGGDLPPEYAKPLPPVGKAEKQPVVRQPVERNAAPEDWTWGGLAKGMYENAPQSAMKVVDNTARAIADPVGTVTTLGELGRGLIRKGEDYLNPNPSVREPENDPQRQRDLATTDAVIGDYKDKWGSIPGAVRRLSTDPFDPLSDLALAPAAAAKVPGKVGKIARVAQTVLDPNEAISAAARKVATPVADAGNVFVRGWMAFHSQKGMEPYRVVQEAAKIEGPEGVRARAVLKRHMSKQGDPSEFADAALNSFEEIKKKASDDYRLKFADQMKTARPLDFKIVGDATREMTEYLNGSHRSPEDVELARQAYNIVKDRYINPKYSKDIEGFDQMKIDLRERADKVTDLRLKKKIYEMANAAKQTIIDGGHPEYAKMMEDWQGWIDQAQDLKSTLGTGRKNIAESTLIKNLQKAMKDDRKGELMQRLAETEAGKDLPYMIAGDSLKNWMPDYAMGNLAMMAPAALAHVGHLIGNPALWAKAAVAIPGAIAASPKIGGKTTATLGAARRVGSKVEPWLNNPITRQPLYQSGKLQEEEDDGVLRASIRKALGPKEASGGRVGSFKAGGRISSHEQIADQLVAAAERAKKAHSRSTEPLLRTPDDMVAKALQVANRSI